MSAGEALCRTAYRVVRDAGLTLTPTLQRSIDRIVTENFATLLARTRETVLVTVAAEVTRALTEQVLDAGGIPDDDRERMATLVAEGRGGDPSELAAWMHDAAEAVARMQEQLRTLIVAHGGAL